jgi:hypothetical protein
MFVGSINSKIRLLIFTEKKLFSERNICIGCSGNFTVEQILQGLDCKIWSNDVALYSSLIGHHLAGNHSCLEIRDPRYSWIEPYIAKGGVDRIAAVALLFEMLKNEKGNNLQQSRMWAHYRENFEKFHEKSCARIAKTLSAIRISRYTTVDAHDLYRDLPKDWIRVAFLPTYVGGYEKLYECLDKIFSWDAPAYQVLTKERYEATLAFMRRGQYLYLSDYDRKEEGLFAIVKTGRLRNVYLYSNMPFKKSYVIPHAKSVPGGFALLPPGKPDRVSEGRQPAHELLQEPIPQKRDRPHDRRLASVRVSGRLPVRLSPVRRYPIRDGPGSGDARGLYAFRFCHREPHLQALEAPASGHQDRRAPADPQGEVSAGGGFHPHDRLYRQTRLDEVSGRL